MGLFGFGFVESSLLPVSAGVLESLLSRRYQDLQNDDSHEGRHTRWHVRDAVVLVILIISM